MIESRLKLKGGLFFSFPFVFLYRLIGLGLEALGFGSNAARFELGTFFFHVYRVLTGARKLSHRSETVFFVEGDSFYVGGAHDEIDLRHAEFFEAEHKRVHKSVPYPLPLRFGQNVYMQMRGHAFGKFALEYELETALSLSSTATKEVSEA